MRGAANFFVFFLLICSLVFAIPGAEVEINKRNVTLGEDLNYTVNFDINFLKGRSLNFVENFSDNTALVVLSQNYFQTEKQIKKSYQLSFFELGIQKIPTLTIIAGTENIVFTPLTINVVSAFDRQGTRDFILNFKPQENIRLKWWNYLAVLIIIGAIVTAIFKFREKLNKKPTAKEEQEQLKLNAYQLALQKLQALQSENVWQKDLKEYCFRLSFIMKEYLSSVFDFPFLESTTYEIKSKLPDYLSKENTDALYSYFISLDPVKYANNSLSPSEAKGKIKLTESLLELIEEYLKQQKEPDNELQSF
ncbi:MAG: hypothetical protein PHV30_02745 [Candidatus Margulisbacteria bacterium]|nr:hypothetical protein [Candidatus Margulisiibacteriota bacterium]